MALSETAQRKILWAGLVILVLGIRVACVWYERTRPFPTRQVQQREIDEDLLVVVPKFRVSDLQTAQQLVGQTLWVKLGYAVEYLPYGTGRESTGASRHFVPLETLRVEEVVEISSNTAAKEVMLVFRKDNAKQMTTAGIYDKDANSYRFNLDELFYPTDPRQLYSHWSPEVWKTVEGHGLQIRMTLTQVLLSLGFGRLVTLEAGGIQLYEFSRHPGGKPGKTRVRFLDGRVKEFELR